MKAAFYIVSTILLSIVSQTKTEAKLFLNSRLCWTDIKRFETKQRWLMRLTVVSEYSSDITKDNLIPICVIGQ